MRARGWQIVGTLESSNTVPFLQSATDVTGTELFSTAKRDPESESPNSLLCSRHNFSNTEVQDFWGDLQTLCD